MAGNFVAKLEERRGSSSMRTFAKKLGISASGWSRIVRGIYRPGPKVIDAALNEYPELAYWLAQDAKAAREKEEA